ncbi:hypothetical protein D3C75_773080 [compost metagenome]
MGRRWLALDTAVRTSSSDRPYWLSNCGSTAMRTAGNELPPICTSPTPGTWARLCDRMVSARSYSWPFCSTSEVSDSTMIGACDGLIFL